MLSDKNKIIADYAYMGAKWLAGAIKVKKWQIGEKELILSPKQVEFLDAKDRYLLISGGIASGKTTILLLKAILLALWFPKNRILLGRRTKMLVEKITLPDFFDLCPPEFAEYKVGAGIIEFFNGSQIILFGLDALQNGTQQDIKKAEQELKSLNLGAIVIDQMEEIEERVFQALGDRLRRDVPFRQFIATTNPANYWAYNWFKANPRPNTKLIEISTLENKANLPTDFIEDRLSRPQTYVRRYIYGEWSPEVVISGGVFEEDYIKNQLIYLKEPIRTFDGIKIFEEPKQEEYQIGIDPSEGAVDPGCVQVVSKTSGRQVAVFSGFVPGKVLAEKAVRLGLMYSLVRKPYIVPEANAAGVSCIEHLKMLWNNIYQREVFSYREQRKLKKLGFNTSHASKLTLIEHFRNLLNKGAIKISDKATHAEMLTFIWTDEARHKGAGAQKGYHDDRIMALMLAYWKVNPLGIGEVRKANYPIKRTRTYQFI